MTTFLPSVCGAITINLHGAAATAQLETGGEYRPTGDWRAGRPVFSNGVKYLCVRPGSTEWCVTESPWSNRSRLMSGGAIWCPASPRAAVSHSDNIRSWRYRYANNNYNWRAGDILVTCDTQQHHFRLGPI